MFNLPSSCLLQIQSLPVHTRAYAELTSLFAPLVWSADPLASKDCKYPYMTTGISPQ